MTTKKFFWAGAPHLILERLQHHLQTFGISAYIMPHSTQLPFPRKDERHGPCVQKVVGFTGSAGFLVVTAQKVSLWVDGRYPLQATQEIEAFFGASPPLPVEICTGGLQHAWESLESSLAPHAVVAWDGWAHSVEMHHHYEQHAHRHQWTMLWDGPFFESLACTAHAPDAATKVWSLEEGPQALRQPILTPFSQKCHTLFSALPQTVAHILVCHPSHSAWLLNMRSNQDPMGLGLHTYVLVHRHHDHYGAEIFLMPGATSDSQHPDMHFLPLKDLWARLDCWPTEQPLFYDPRNTPYALLGMYPHLPWHTCAPAFALARARKTPPEIGAMERSYEKDGVAMVRFLHWLSTRGPGVETEESAAHQLELFRRQEPAYRGPSFPTISAAGANSALIHYVPKAGACHVVGSGLYLVDAGGQYCGDSTLGTTDTTRTIWLGPDLPTQEHREMFTAVLQAHIHLCTLAFDAHVGGSQLDAAARSFLWQKGAQYDHSTGHGVGLYLSVHEAVPSISPRSAPDAFEVGMVCSNEPGYYRAGWGGIRLENVVTVVQHSHALSLRPLTLVPFDRTLLLPEVLSLAHRHWLQHYHGIVYKTLAPHVEPVVRQWLWAATRPV